MHSVDDTRRLRAALGTFATGVAIVTTTAEDARPVGITINSFASVSLAPPLILWSLAAASPNAGLFRRGERFAVHVLALEQQHLSRRFATSMDNKFGGVPWAPDAHGLPCIEGCAARFSCSKVEHHQGGDHMIIVGRVEAFEHAQRDALIFLQGRYARATAPPACAAA